DAAQTVGSASTRQVVVRTKDLNTVQINKALASLNALHPKSLSQSSVSSSWGTEVTKKAIQALVVFLILVSIYIAIRFQPRMAVGAFVSLLHDLIVTAGVYARVGFEVTPSTVVGLLTILGFSLYDTVVVFDKVRENTRGLLGLTRRTYAEAANLALNQTLMRSFNTAFLALLPITGLLIVGYLLLG